MADYSCNYCQDRGDCIRCSPFFEPDKEHSRCKRLWSDHKVHLNEPGSGYPPWYSCPK